jgi:1,4-alpha-glucan branching enzyme
MENLRSFKINSILKADPDLKPYRDILERRNIKIQEKEKELICNYRNLAEFASGYKYFGMHKHENGFVFREWAPNAEKIFLTGDFNSWKEEESLALRKIKKNGIWEIYIPDGFLKHGDKYKLKIYWPGGYGERIPSYARRVVQDPGTDNFNAQVWMPETAYKWKNKKLFKESGLFIYEAHVGMAQEEEKVGTFREFTEKIIPRIKNAGYTALQLMAVAEHPYYASFGYQVSSFFAPSSRFGTPEDLKELIDTAHSEGLYVIMDLVHSHAVKNEAEGLSRFDGTVYQYFHEGPRGFHNAWDSRCFDYARNEVLHFLLSNCRYWLDEFHFDGFRFDGITSMIYHDHGMNREFCSYNDYYGSNVDEDALVYLALANKLIHEIKKDAVTIAEDVSGMPFLALPSEHGGYGFDYRYAMGIPDFWIKILKSYKDENWPLGQIWHELNNRRKDEKSISYAESHDQAMVGDKTLISHMLDADIYNHMNIKDNNMRVDRGIVLHKIIRLLTLATAGSGYQNFMGNEFGHPEWIDFPRIGNNWSYHYARRQWSLAFNPDLKYRYLLIFDRDMIGLARTYSIYSTGQAELLHEHNDNKILAFLRSGLVFVFNLHPSVSYTDYLINASPGKYAMIFCSDFKKYGGFDRLNPGQVHFTMMKKEKHFLSLYLPARTAIVLKQE